MLPHYNLVIISVPGIIMCMLLFLLHYNVCLFHFHTVLAPQLTVSHSEPDSELIVSDSGLTFPHIPLIFYNIYIYHISKKKFILFHLFHLIPYLNLLFWG